MPNFATARKLRQTARARGGYWLLTDRQLIKGPSPRTSSSSARLRRVVSRESSHFD